MVKIGLMFPGQGSQYAGMGKELYDTQPAAREILDKTNDIIGFDLKKIIFEGPEETLRLTQYTQPAIFAVSFAAFKVFSLNFKLETSNCLAAGHSLGEYSALAAAGAFSFEDGLRLVKARGEFIRKASEKTVGAMAAIIGLEVSKVEEICRSAKDSGACEAVNYNSPGQIVIAGTVDSVKAAVDLAVKAGAMKAVMLNVSGPFHSTLMTPAAEMMREEIKKYNFTDPSFPVVANCDASPSKDAGSIKEKLVKQINSPVLWEQSITKMAELGAKTFIEIGPQKVLSGLLRRIDKTMRSFNIDDAKSLEKTLQGLKS
jgi:[acyl-carrier-protein] S-malonyltransferase